MADSCRCGEHLEVVGFPVLKATDIPHSVRHASILGALDSLQPGSGLVVVVPHEPIPLLHQVNKQLGDKVEISYLQEGPDDWHVQFRRVA